LEIILLTVLTLYFLEHLVIFIVLQKSFNLSSVNHEPTVSLIVAAKNEEENIAKCIDSLLKLKYPAQKLEIIVINDNSIDRTGEIIRSYGDRIKYIETEASANLKGKANALAQAIKKSTGEMIFTTDADCIVNPSWVTEMVKYYDERTGVVCSYSLPEPRNLFWGVQSFDWLYLLTLSSGSAGLNDQLSCVGNNMSYRRKAYEEVGGYEKIKFSVTEDFMLLQTIKRKTKWGTRFPVNLNILNYTLPCMSLKELYRQKKRWGRGGLDINWFGYLVGFIGWASAVVIIFSWLFVSLKLYLIFLLSKTLIDFLFTFPVIKRLEYYSLIALLIPFEIYFAIYAFLLPFIVSFGSVVWKNQKL
jgi:cellulose synthase/poly-beta-1,6-N-acetylglucosamine synthase-like glycosyltransferase